MPFKIRWFHVLFLMIMMVQMCIVPIMDSNERTTQKIDFVTRRVYGKITLLRIGVKSTCTVVIKDSNSSTELKYILSGSKFIKENAIQVGDSISKAENEMLAIFYKFDGKSYKKCCECNLASLFL